LSSWCVRTVPHTKREEEEEEEKEKEEKEKDLVSLSHLSRLFSSLFSRCFFFHFFFEKKRLSDTSAFFLSFAPRVCVIFSLFLFSARGKRSSGRAKDARAHTQRQREREIDTTRPRVFSFFYFVVR
jgi:hypothetical protein